VLGVLWLLFRKFQTPDVSTEVSKRIEKVHVRYRDIRAKEESKGI